MGALILTVCPNPALDVTYRVPAYEPGDSVRVSTVHSRAGGKGTNVARVVTALGASSLLVGFAGGRTGRDLVCDLDASGMTHTFLPVDGETRRTLTVVSPTTTTGFNEPGPPVRAADWDRLIDLVRRRSADADAVTVSGSLPPGSPDDACARLVAASAAPVVIDTSGPPLVAALAGRPAVVKINQQETGDALGRPVRTPQEALAACEEFLRLGALSCIVTLGAAGLVGVHEHRRIRVRIGRAVAGNPTGAGDAFTAALAVGLAVGRDLDATVRDAAAVAGAAVACGTAGAFDPVVRADLIDHITLEELP